MKVCQYVKESFIQLFSINNWDSVISVYYEILFQISEENISRVLSLQFAEKSLLRSDWHLEELLLIESTIRGPNLKIWINFVQISRASQLERIDSHRDFWKGAHEIIKHPDIWNRISVEENKRNIEKIGENECKSSDLNHKQSNWNHAIHVDNNILLSNHIKSLTFY